MDRREFLQGIAAAMASGGQITADAPEAAAVAICEFRLGPVTWKVFENPGDRDGAITFVASSGEKRVLAKTAEATFAEATPPYLGLSLSDIGLANADLLADRLLAQGDPDPDQVKSAAPPLGSARDQRRSEWTSFVGTKEACDTAPVFYGGNTRTYHPMQEMPELAEALRTRHLYEGLLGGWMPAVRKIFPIGERLVHRGDRFRRRGGARQVHRADLAPHGASSKTARWPRWYMDTATRRIPPVKEDPAQEQFYRALLVFADYWDRQLADFAPTTLPA